MVDAAEADLGAAVHLQHARIHPLGIKVQGLEHVALQLHAVPVAKGEVVGRNGLHIGRELVVQAGEAKLSFFYIENYFY